jgi:hypothetical protein
LDSGFPGFGCLGVVSSQSFHFVTNILSYSNSAFKIFFCTHTHTHTHTHTWLN